MKRLKPESCGIYVIVFPNGKAYVGKTIKPIMFRLKQHLAAAARGSKLAVHAAIRKHYPKGVFTAFEGHSHDKLQRAEVKVISALRKSGRTLYNCTDGGDGIAGFSHSDATRQKQSDSATKSWTDERRKLASDKLLSPDVNLRLSASIKKSWTRERRLSFSQSKKGKAHNSKFTETDIRDIDKMLLDGRSCASISRIYNVTPEAISRIKHGHNWSHVTSRKPSIQKQHKSCVGASAI